jgi:hypothetical protein
MSVLLAIAVPQLTHNALPRMSETQDKSEHERASLAATDVLELTWAFLYQCERETGIRTPNPLWTHLENTTLQVIESSHVDLVRAEKRRTSAKNTRRKNRTVRCERTW